MSLSPDELTANMSSKPAGFYPSVKAWEGKWLGLLYVIVLRNMFMVKSVLKECKMVAPTGFVLSYCCYCFMNKINGGQ